MKYNRILKKLSILLIPFFVYIFWSILFYNYSKLVPIKDAYYYKLMSESPFDPSVSAPFCFRILTPLLAYLIPLDSFTSFYLINTIFFIATAVLFYYFLKNLGFNSLFSLIGEVIFTIGSVSNLYLIHNYIMVDQLNQFIFLLACYIICSKNRLNNNKWNMILMGLLIIGILNKETILLLAPIYIVLVSGKIYEKFYKTLIIFCPAILIFIILRLTIPYTGTYEGIWIFFHMENLMSTIYNLFLTYSLFWMLAFYNFKTEIEFLNKTYWTIPIFIAQIFLASNIYRLIFLSFPIVIPLGLIELQRYKRSFGNYLVIFVLFCQISISICYILKTYLEFDFLNIFYFPLIVISTLVVTIISLYLYLKRDI
ncbi:MAG: hypothetical protein ACTSPQ_10030 [Candidatus Helarchaeota archaeon]